MRRDPSRRKDDGQREKRRDGMGDKGKRDKEKGQKQKARKQAQKSKKKLDKQQRKIP
jgi:hypothetical protein